MASPEVNGATKEQMDAKIAHVSKCLLDYDKCAMCSTPARHYLIQGNSPPVREMMLPTDSATRKEIPITTGVLDYFPLAIAAVARLSKKGNDKHNLGQPLHWSRDKSTDHADCIGKHLIDRGTIDPDSGMSHTVNIAWRALALLELEEEQRLGKPPARGSVLT